MFNLHLRPGVNFSKLSLQNEFFRPKNIDFENQTNFRFGVELEFVMPFNKNKWAIFLEPTYQSFNSEKTEGNKTFSVDYESLELPIGIRHYFFLSDKSKLFINSAYVLDFAKDSAVLIGNQSNVNDNSTDLVFKTGNNLIFGAGFNYNSKFSIEFRQSTNRDILKNFVFW